MGSAVVARSPHAVARLAGIRTEAISSNVKRGPDMPDPVSDSLARPPSRATATSQPRSGESPGPHNTRTDLGGRNGKAMPSPSVGNPPRAAEHRRPTDRVGYFLARFAFFAFFFLPFFLAAIRVLVRVG